jgi:hypothetical protein
MATTYNGRGLFSSGGGAWAVYEQRQGHACMGGEGTCIEAWATCVRVYPRQLRLYVSGADLRGKGGGGEASARRHWWCWRRWPTWAAANKAEECTL